MTKPLALFAAASAVLALSACGGGSDAAGDPGGDSGGGNAAAAAEGKRLSDSKGCAACHGANGEGGVGPTWVGLYGSEVTLADGTTVTADDAYLIQSIKDPASQIVADYRVPMPVVELTDAEIASFVAYIQELSG